MHTLMYHDVFADASSHHASGFQDDTAAVYKLPLSLFLSHLERLAGRLPNPPFVVPRGQDSLNSPDRDTWAITFDDGGVSAHEHVAPALEKLGWRGHFFVTTSCIDTEGFLSGQQIREMHERGHVIGAHSHSHPPRISALSQSSIREEWSVSVKCLEEITGAPIVAASVPGGYYSRSVGEAAASVGIRFLFNSEPTPTSGPLGQTGCLLLGRYSIKTDTTPAIAAALASGSLAPRLLMQAGWQIRRLAKISIGTNYEAIRRILLSQRNSNQ